MRRSPCQCGRLPCLCIQTIQTRHRGERGMGRSCLASGCNSQSGFLRVCSDHRHCACRKRRNSAHYDFDRHQGQRKTLGRSYHRHLLGLEELCKRLDINARKSCGGSSTHQNSRASPGERPYVNDVDNKSYPSCYEG